MDIYQPSKRQRRQPKVWLDPLNLLQKDRDILLSPTGWVTDSIINAAEQLLRQRFPQLPGLQDVALGQTMAFTIMTGEFVQILHTSRDHWLTISNIGEQHPYKIRVYDSMFIYYIIQFRIEQKHKLPACCTVNIGVGRYFNLGGLSHCALRSALG